MAEAAVLGMIRDLKSMDVTCTDIYEGWFIERKIRTDFSESWIIKRKIEKLKEVLDLLRELKMEKRSSLKYLMADLVELAQDLMDMRPNEYSTFMLLKLKDEIKMTKTRMIKFGADEKNIGDVEAEVEEEDDGGVEGKCEAVTSQSEFEIFLQLRDFQLSPDKCTRPWLASSSYVLGYAFLVTRDTYGTDTENGGSI